MFIRTRTAAAFLAFCALAPNNDGGGGSAGGASGGSGGDAGAGGAAAGAGAGSGSAGGAGSAGGQNGAGSALTWDAWHGTLTDEQKGLLEGHTKGLKNALDTERSSRGELEKQIRELSKKADKGSEAEQELTKLADQLKAREKQTGFQEIVGAAGCRNLRLAWAAAQQDENVWKRDGSLDLEAFKKGYPELFGPTNTTTANAGAGAGQSGGTSDDDMNALIRRKAGRG